MVLVVDRAEVASWALERSGRLDVAFVEELARVQLAAKVLGWSVGLRDVAPELADLLDLVGLRGVLTAPEGR